MQVYMFHAALLCEDCGETACNRTPFPEYATPDDEGSYDSDDYPKGPYSNGGGEADSPQHCDDCGAFLENPLTDDGYEYVQDVLDNGRKTEISALWAGFYNLTPTAEHRSNFDADNSKPEQN